MQQDAFFTRFWPGERRRSRPPHPPRPALPRGLGYLAFVAAALLVFVYVGRLIILDPKSPALLAAAVAVGYVVNPVWFVWLAVALRRKPVGTVAAMAPSLPFDTRDQRWRAACA